MKLDRSLLLLSLVAFLYCHGVGPGLVKLVWAWSIHGMLFNIFSQISHVNEVPRPPLPSSLSSAPLPPLADTCDKPL